MPTYRRPDLRPRVRQSAWLARALDRGGSPTGFQSPEEAARDPQVTANEIVVPLEGVDELDATISSPITVRASPKVRPGAAPASASTTTRSSPGSASAAPT